jgi:hypothetical protein
MAPILTAAMPRFNNLGDREASDAEVAENRGEDKGDRGTRVPRAFAAQSS